MEANSLTQTNGHDPFQDEFRLGGDDLLDQQAEAGAEATDEDVPPNDSWYVVRNTPGVTGFVGAGTHPSPLEEPEVKRILRRMKMEAPRVKVSFTKDERVKVVDGPFTD